MGIFKTLFGSYSDREIKRLMPLVEKTEALGERYAQMSEADLRGQTERFKARLAQGETLDDILPEAFATVREAAKRVLGMYHFRVQLIGGIVLHQGRIAEMKTGEGKTLVATLPVYLNALTGRGVHVVTVNDYLARRDSEWMGKVYRYLGLTVGLIVHGLDNDERRTAYAADITYGTNNEFGFDYLRDNMVDHKEECVQRALSFAIVDEVDSILIDEARTPLIISGSGEASSDRYEQADRFVRSLKSKTFRKVDSKQTMEEKEEMEGDADYIIDEKAKSAVLTKRGVAKAERFFNVENLSDQSNYVLNNHINNALKAHGTMFRDQNYVVQDDEVVIVDDFTGRLMEGRRYSNGLHQAIEAKEGVKIKRESRTLATITFQNYFRMYGKLSGMTGTAKTEEEEFREIYKLDVIEIPTNKPLARVDLPDVVYKTERGKFSQVIEKVRQIHETGQPVLIGTISVEKSEILSQLFTRAGIPHHVLNAKQHAREAEIVAQAGRLGAVTISTNMAGRGTDIMLGGNPEHLAKQAMRQEGLDEELIEQSTAHNETDDKLVLDARAKFKAYYDRFAVETDAEKEKVVQAGGLYIIGTERHESRRIDNQLRGRSGRQGDPGCSCFFVSLGDDLMRLFGGERMDRIFNGLGVEEDMEIQHPMLSKAIENAQRRVESQNFSIRKHVLQYDDVMNTQRDIIYRQRRDVLEGKSVHDYYTKNLRGLLEQVLLDYCADQPDSELWDKEAMIVRLEDLFGDLPIFRERLASEDILDAQDLLDEFDAAAQQRLAERQKLLHPEELFYELERMILLNTVDRYWMDHIDMMDDLRDAIGMRGYAQHDPVIEYKREGYDMFEAMTNGIREDSIRLIMRANLLPEAAPRQERPRREQLRESRKEDVSAYNQARREQMREAQAAGGPARSEPVKRQQMPGRNDPCWCGSGKKYKNCHYQSDQAK